MDNFDSSYLEVVSMASNKSVFIFAVSLDEINCFPLYSDKEPKDKSLSNTLERQETGQLQKSDKFENASVIKYKNDTVAKFWQRKVLLGMQIGKNWIKT